MSTTDSPNLGLPYILAAQAQKHVTHNEAIRALDAVVQLAVLDRDLAAPPAIPADGDRYIVAASPTGAWTGQAGNIAAFQDGAWVFYLPREGWLAWVADEDLICRYKGTAWAAASGAASVNPTPLVGVNTTADTTNRLAVSSPATLLNHEGAGHQVKVNKNAAANSASFLFQTAFSGRAEMGTTGDDDFHFKVSPDGAAWTEAIAINKTTGLVTLTSKSVANAALADVPTATFKGRTTAATGVPEDLTATQATAMLNAVVGDAGSGGTKGLVPAPAAGDAAASRFLKADGTWATPAAGATTQVQFNDAGAFGGAAGIVYDKTTRKVTFTALDTLFNHNGASKQIQVNKNAAADSASFLFQTAFSGRAEFGLTGDDDFHLKVSADGSAWNEAWIINRTSAEVSVRKALAIEDQASAPATPATGMKLWSRSMAGRRHLYAVDPAGNSYPLQPHIARNRVGRWNPIGNATTAPLAEGIVPPTATGTATARNVATTNLATSLRRLGYVSAGTAGSLAGPRMAATQFWRGNAAGLGGFTFYCRFMTSDAAAVSGARMFVGLSASTGAPTNVEPNTVDNSVGVGQIAASNNLQIITRDGTTAQTIDLGANFPANTLSADAYELMLFCAPNSSSIGYRVERLNTGQVAEGTLSTNLPVNTTLMGIQLWRCNNATALAVGLDLVHLQIETDA